MLEKGGQIVRLFYLPVRVAAIAPPTIIAPALFAQDQGGDSGDGGEL